MNNIEDVPPSETEKSPETPPSVSNIEMEKGPDYFGGIGEDSSIADLYQKILESQGVRGSAEDYSPVELIVKIDKTLRDDFNIKRITNGEGLRDAFLRVVRNEGIRDDVENREIASASNFGELYARVLAHGPFKNSSGEEFSTYTYLTVIDNVRIGVLTLKSVTRMDGLRPKVKELLESRV